MKVVYYFIVLIFSLFVSSNTYSSEANDAQALIDDMVTEYPDSVRNFQLALAKRGNLTAQLTLAKLYHYGIGVEIDINIAEQWYMLAAESGSDYASDMLVYLEIKSEGYIQEKHEKWSEEFVKREDSAPALVKMISNIRDIKKTQASLKIPAAAKAEILKPLQVKPVVKTEYPLTIQPVVEIRRSPEVKRIVATPLPHETKQAVGIRVPLKTRRTESASEIFCGKDDCNTLSTSQN